MRASHLTTSELRDFSAGSREYKNGGFWGFFMIFGGS
jgi:hypothetical protein